MFNFLKWGWLIALSLILLLWIVPVFSVAPSPPQLTTIEVDGKTENLLLITRSEDTVLVRCYPGFAPSLTIGEPEPIVSTTGYLKCKPENREDV